MCDCRPFPCFIMPIRIIVELSDIKFCHIGHFCRLFLPLLRDSIIFFSSSFCLSYLQLPFLSYVSIYLMCVFFFKYGLNSHVLQICQTFFPKVTNSNVVFHFYAQVRHTSHLFSAFPSLAKPQERTPSRTSTPHSL